MTDNELAELLYSAGDLGLYNTDVSDLNIYVRGQKLSTVTVDGLQSSFWVVYSDGIDTEIELTEKEKKNVLKEVLAWC